jgi:diacylglycerol kinase
MELITRFLKGFVYAFRGLGFVTATQRNFRIQILIALVAVSLSYYLNISVSEWLAIIICVGMVLAAECFNTALEKLVDLVSPEFNKQAGLVKDVAAAAVLVCAITVITIALVIFVPKFF